MDSESPTISYALVDPSSEPVIAGLRRSAWIKIGIVTVLFLGIFWPNLRRIWNKTNPISGDPNWQHGILVPLVGLYYLYINREELLKAQVKASWTGLVILVLGLGLSMYSIYPLQNDFFWDVGMVVTLFGATLLLCGWQVMRLAWFPIIFLCFAIPWPGLFYSKVAWPLQELAAQSAVKVLQYTGVDAGRAGSKIFFLGRNEQLRTLNVAEACAGLRSLMTFMSVGTAVAFLSARPMWQRAVITISALPIAIFCNVMRVAGQGLIDYYWRQDFAHGFAHTFVGLVMLIPAFFMILMVTWLLDHMFLDEASEEEKAKLANVSKKKIIVAGAVAPRHRASVVMATSGGMAKPMLAVPPPPAAGLRVRTAAMYPPPSEPLPHSTSQSTINESFRGGGSGNGSKPESA